MIVKDLLDTIGGNTNILICGTTEKDKYVDLWKGTGDDIKFPLVPYAKYEIEHTSVSDNTLVIVLDSSLNFAEMNPETVGMTAYIGTQLETDVVMDTYNNLMKCPHCGEVIGNTADWTPNYCCECSKPLSGGNGKCQ